MELRPGKGGAGAKNAGGEGGAPVGGGGNPRPVHRRRDQGHGVDHNLLMLALSLKDGEDAPQLLSHPLHARAKQWWVSISPMSHPRFDNWEYREVTPGGVGSPTRSTRATACSASPP